MEIARTTALHIVAEWGLGFIAASLSARSKRILVWRPLDRPSRPGCLSRVPYIVGFICVLVHLASWGDAMNHALNKLSSPCSELLAGERVIRSDAMFQSLHKRESSVRELFLNMIKSVIAP